MPRIKKVRVKRDRSGRNLLRKRAKKLKRSQTKPEIIFGRRLKDAGYFYYSQRVVGYYIADFVIPKKMLIIEIDGDSHNEAVDYDRRRDYWLGKFGFKVLRIRNENASSFDLYRLQEYPDCIEVKKFRTYRSALLKANKERNNNKEYAAKAKVTVDIPKVEDYLPPMTEKSQVFVRNRKFVYIPKVKFTPSKPREVKVIKKADIPFIIRIRKFKGEVPRYVLKKDLD